MEVLSMFKKLFQGLAVLATLLVVAGCVSTGTGNLTMRGGKAEATPPALATRATEAKGETHDYIVTLYPGVGQNFNPNPRMTLDEYNQLAQLDWFCTKKVEELSGTGNEMFRQGATYGGFQGFLGALGARLAFGPAVNAADYLLYIGATGLGGGLGSGKISAEMARSVAHGYCMTGMIYKADQLEGKLSRLFVIPVYTGKAPVPVVSDASAPAYPRTRSGYIAPPPR